MAAFAALALALGLAACDLVTAPLPPRAERFVPPAVYARWWAMTEACSARSGQLSDINWYRVPGYGVVLNGDAAVGFFGVRGNRIVLASEETDAGTTVRHEMLHALLRVGSHPRSQFLGACAALVGCEASCASDAAPWRPPLWYLRRDYVVLPPDSLELRIRHELLPREADGQRYFALTISIANPQARPVVVAVPAWQGPPLPEPELPPGFAFDLRGPAGGSTSVERVSDSSAVFFQPFETKQRLFDFRIASELSGGRIPPGQYLVRGGYGRRWTAYDTVTIQP